MQLESIITNSKIDLSAELPALTCVKFLKGYRPSLEESYNITSKAPNLKNVFLKDPKICKNEDEQLESRTKSEILKVFGVCKSDSIQLD